MKGKIAVTLNVFTSKIKLLGIDSFKSELRLGKLTSGYWKY